MSASRALLVAVLVLLHAGARAQHEGAIAGGIAASSAAASATRQAAHDDRVPGVELPEYSDARSGSTARIASGCEGVTLEAAISSLPGRNVATVTLVNDSAGPIAFVPSLSRFRFEGGAYRRFVNVSPDVPLDPGWLVTHHLTFPDKTSFDGARKLELEVRVLPDSGEACALRVTFERNPAQAMTERSVVSYTSLELELGLGTRFVETGGLGELGRGLSLHLDFAGFFSVHHGLSFNLVADLHGTGGLARVTDEELGAHPSISGTGFLVGYMGRVYITPWLSAVYNLASGPYVFELTSDAEDGPELSTAVFPLRQRVRLAADFLTLEDGSRFSLAASLTHLYVPYGDFGRVALSGNSLAVTLALMISG